MTPSNLERFQIVSIRKIWDRALHNGMTDLVYFQNRWFCTFRESDTHAFGIHGVIRIISSKDLCTWESVALLSEKGVDLRDPKFSVTPGNRLMLLIGGTVLDREGNYLFCQSRVSFSHDGFQWDVLKLILHPHEWLWRITWNQSRAYGVSYRFSNAKDRMSEWLVNLFESTNGVDYKLITHLDVPGYPNETTLRFTDEGEMIALMRRDQAFQNQAWIGKSAPPFVEWNWKASKHYFGGPNFLILKNGLFLASGRVIAVNPYGFFEKTALAEMKLYDLKPILILPSGGDTSYPGMVVHNHHLWISYYSSHEKNTAIYLACIKIDI